MSSTSLNALAEEVDKLTVTDRSQLKDIAEQVEKLEELVKEHKRAIVYTKQQRKSFLIDAIDKFNIVNEALINKTNEEFDSNNETYEFNLTKITEPVSFQGTKQFITIENNSICMPQNHYFELVITDKELSEQLQLGFAKYMMCVLGTQYTGSELIKEKDGSMYKVYTGKSILDNKDVHFSFSGKPDGSDLYFYQI